MEQTTIACKTFTISADQEGALSAIIEAFLQPRASTALHLYNFKEKPVNELYQPCRRCGEQPNHCLCRAEPYSPDPP